MTERRGPPRAATAVSNVQLRGATGDPADVGITGMFDGSIQIGVYVLNATDVLIADLNIFRGIHCADGATLGGPAVLLWRGSSDSLVERNTFLASSRGVQLGRLQTAGDHSGGIVRNNFFRVEPSAPFWVETAIGTVSSNSRILYNSIVAHGQLFATVEARFAATTNVTIQNNLMDPDAIRVRDGATITQLGNIANGESSWFANEAGGDLHLVQRATAAIDQVDRLADAEDDFDAVTRPSGSGEADVGADELTAIQVPTMGTLGRVLLAAGLVLLAALGRRHAARNA